MTVSHVTDLPTSQDTVLLIATAVLLLLVLIMLIVRRSAAQRTAQAAQAEARQAALQLDTLFTATKQPLLQVDTQGIIVAANPAATELLSVKTVPIGVHFTTVVPQHITAAPLTKKSRHHHYFITLQDTPTTPTATSTLSVEQLCQGSISNLQHTLTHMATLYQQGVATPHTVEPLIARARTHAYVIERAIHNTEMLSHIATHTPTVSSISLRDIVTEVYNSFVPYAEEKSLHLNIDTGSYNGDVMTDPAYLRELLEELVHNAITYTEEGSITIKLAKRGNTITISVKDSGIGISKSEQTAIFEPRYRSKDHRVQAIDGTGLGLHLADQLAHALDSTLQVKSRLNHGSEFTLEVPINTSITTG